MTAFDTLLAFSASALAALTVLALVAPSLVVPSTGPSSGPSSRAGLDAAAILPLARPRTSLARRAHLPAAATLLPGVGGLCLFAALAAAGHPPVLAGLPWVAGAIASGGLLAHHLAGRNSCHIESCHTETEA